MHGNKNVIYLLKWQDCGSAKHGTIRMASFDLNIIKGRKEKTE